MKIKILICMLGLLLSSLNVFADDVSIDSSGNVKTGVSNSNAELEVTGASGEGGIRGTTSGTGASGVYGINTTYGDYGILGYYGYGVYGYSSNWAGYFQGNTRVTGNLTVDGSIIGPVIGDITGVTAGTGLSGGGTSGDVTLNADTTYLQRRVSSSCTAGSSIRTINEDGTVLCETSGGTTSENDPEVGSNTTNYIPRWNGSALVTGTIYDDGNIGIGTTSPSQKLTVAGTIETTSGGVKFPDGTLQVTAVTRPLCELYRALIVNNLSSPSLPDICLYSTLPDTGQTVDYTTTVGEDSDYTMNPPSYTVTGDTVTDKVTGLMWQREDDNQLYNWYEASGVYDATWNPGTTNVCGSSTVGGYTDWRLPDRFELMSIVNYGTYSPSIDAAAFPNTDLSYYWSSTTSASFTAAAWGMDFSNGYVYGYYKPEDVYIRCVRGGQGTAHSFTANGDGTVTDNVTGLMWQQDDDNTTRTWEEAITYCEDLVIPPSTFTDWRLPNSKELSSIVDNAHYNPSIDTTAFPNTNSSEYWSSTTDAYYPADAWYVYFNTGYVSSYDKTYYYYVRCTRGGQ